MHEKKQIQKKNYDIFRGDKMGAKKRLKLIAINFHPQCPHKLTALDVLNLIY